VILGRGGLGRSCGGGGEGLTWLSSSVDGMYDYDAEKGTSREHRSGIFCLENVPNKGVADTRS
jgi:hypothetical protein